MWWQVYKGIHKIFTQLKVALRLEIGQSITTDQLVDHLCYLKQSHRAWNAVTSFRATLSYTHTHIHIHTHTHTHTRARFTNRVPVVRFGCYVSAGLLKSGQSDIRPRTSRKNKVKVRLSVDGGDAWGFERIVKRRAGVSNPMILNNVKQCWTRDCVCIATSCPPVAYRNFGSRHELLLYFLWKKILQLLNTQN